MTRSLKVVILEILKKNDGSAEFSTIFESLNEQKNEIRLQAKDPKKTVRGILSKLKSDQKIFKKGLRFCLVEKPKN